MQAHEASKALFAQYRALGNAQINKHLLQIMALLLPMRRVCSGGCCSRQYGCHAVAGPVVGPLLRLAAACISNASSPAPSAVASSHHASCAAPLRCAAALQWMWHAPADLIFP